MKSLIISIAILLITNISSAECIRGNCKLGSGTYIFKDGSKFIGSFRNGIPDGKGRIILSNGDRYEGEFVEGKRAGEGKYFFKSGSRYIGQFLNNAFQGKGRMDYANKDIYTGHWKKNKPNGPGKLRYANGKTIEGTWKNGKLKSKSTPEKIKNKKLDRLGESHSTYKDCNNNYCHDEKGRFNYRDGSYYIGDFSKGSPEGGGTCYYANGDVYVGGWKNHGPNGEGIISFTSGRKYSAIWSAGKPIKQIYKNADMEYDTYKRRNRKEADGKTDMYAVVIGISAYNHMPALKYTDDDAYQLYAFLKSPEGGALPENHITLLIDEVATKDNITSSIKNLFEKADRDDVVIMYYSGHGLQGRFIPIDFNGYDNSLSHRELYDLINNTEAKNKVILADACYAGSLSNAKGTYYNSLENFYNKSHDSEGGTAILMSSKAEEQSLEYSGLRQGVFSHFLLKGLHGEADQDNNDIVSISELYKYVNLHVRDYTENRQSPTISGMYDKDMPIAMIR